VNAIYADSVSANGYVYLGGPFTSPKSYLMRVAANGTIDTSWNTGVAGTVFSIAADSNMYVAAYDGSNIPHVYRLDSAGAISATLFATGGTPEPINSIALSTDGSNQLYIGGKFYISDHQNLIAISNPSSSPTVSTSFRADSNSGATVNTVSANGLGRLFVGGNFSSIGGAIRNNIAAIDLNSGEATSWHSPYTGIGEVKAIESDGNSIYVGYDHVSGITPPGVLKIDTNGSAGGQWVTATYSDDIFALNLNDGYLYVGGMFSFLSPGGSGFKNIARISVGSGGPAVDVTWKPSIGSTSDYVDQIIANGDTTYVKGSFTTANAGAANHLVAVQSGSNSVGTSNATGWSNPTFVSAGAPLDSMTLIPANTYAIAPNGALMIGQGTSLKLVPLTGGSTAILWPSAPVISTYMNKATQLVLDENTLYIAGQGNGTTPAQALLTYDLSTQLLTGFSAGIQGSTTVFTVEPVGQGSVLVGGNFTQVNTVLGTGGKMANGIGLFDALSGKLY
jgi:hypothetical protein